MNHESKKAPADVPWRAAGIGLPYTFRCGICNQPMRNLGRRKVKHRGAVVWAGQCCKPDGVDSAKSESRLGAQPVPDYAKESS